MSPIDIRIDQLPRHLFEAERIVGDGEGGTTMRRFINWLRSWWIHVGVSKLSDGDMAVFWFPMSLRADAVDAMFAALHQTLDGTGIKWIMLPEDCGMSVIRKAMIEEMAKDAAAEKGGA
jgi:hypothetical protein